MTSSYAKIKHTQINADEYNLKCVQASFDPWMEMSWFSSSLGSVRDPIQIGGTRGKDLRAFKLTLGSGTRKNKLHGLIPLNAHHHSRGNRVLDVSLVRGSWE